MKEKIKKLNWLQKETLKSLSKLSFEEMEKLMDEYNDPYVRETILISMEIKDEEKYYKYINCTNN